MCIDVYIGVSIISSPAAAGILIGSSSVSESERVRARPSRKVPRCPRVALVSRETSVLSFPVRVCPTPDWIVFSVAVDVGFGNEENRDYIYRCEGQLRNMVFKHND